MDETNDNSTTEEEVSATTEADESAALDQPTDKSAEENQQNDSSDEASDKILTDEERDALVEGVESGEIEVQSSSGPTYASVTPFVIPARAHIVKNGYPRLKILNQQVAERIAREVEQLLQNEVKVNAAEMIVNSYGRICEHLPDSVATIVFEAAPLQGQGLIALEAPMVRLLVDTFFGGDGATSDIYPDSSFTAGELSVSNLFAGIVLSSLRNSWAPLQEIAAERVATEVSIDLVDIVAESDPVICTEYEILLSDQQCLFQVLLPIEMLQPLLPIFDGQKADRDAVEDARWSRAIQRRVVESRINLTSNLSLPEMTVRDLVKLLPGDIIDIEQPHKAVVMAENVRLIDGHLGVHRGHNAVETTGWIDPVQAEITEARI